MVDVPDEQSIVTYVAQFLERFPELEAVRLLSLPQCTSRGCLVRSGPACLLGQRGQTPADLEFLTSPSFSS